MPSNIEFNTSQFGRSDDVSRWRISCH